MRALHDIGNSDDISSMTMASVSVGFCLALKLFGYSEEDIFAVNRLARDKVEKLLGLKMKEA